MEEVHAKSGSDQPPPDFAWTRGTVSILSIHLEEVPLLFMCAAIVGDCITHKFGKMRSNRVVILCKTGIFAIHVAEITVHLIRTVIELVNVLKMPFNLCLNFRMSHTFSHQFCDRKSDGMPLFSDPFKIFPRPSPGSFDRLLIHISPSPF